MSSLRAFCRFTALLLACLSGVSNRLAAQGQWIQRGPDGGGVGAVAIDPRQPSTILAGTGAGIFRSVDSGINWSRVSNGLPAGGISRIAFDPSTPSIVYAAVAAADVLPTQNNSGFYRSTDSGASWTRICACRSSLISLEINPAVPSTMFAAAKGTGAGSIGRSTNSGVTWSNIHQGVTGQVQAFAMHDAVPSVLYVGTLSNGVFRSTDSGDSWTPAAPLPGLNTQVLGIALDPVSPSIVYVSSGVGVLRSTDSGSTWGTAVPVGTPNVAGHLVVDRVTPAILYLAASPGGGGGVFRSTDSGAHWTAVNAGLPVPAPPILELVIHPTMASTLYAGTFQGDGFYRSTNSGSSWTASVSGLTAHRMSGLTLHPQTPGTIYAATGDDGVFRSADGGGTWIPVNTGLTRYHFGVTSLVIDPLTPSTLYAGAIDGVFRSTNGGDTWSLSTTGLTGGFHTLAIHPTNTSVLYAGDTFGVSKSSNGAVSWALVQGTGGGSVIALTVDPVAPSIVYAGTLNGKLFRTTDSGASWADLGAVFGGEAIFDLAIDPSAHSTLYAASSPRGVFRSTDSGTTWTPANAGLGPAAAASLAIDPVAPSTLYVALGNRGLFRSTNSGTTWTEMTTAGLTTPFFIHVALGATDAAGARRVYAAASQGSIFTLDESVPGSPPTISTHPQSQTIAFQQTATLSVAASGSAPLTYQWYAGTSGTTTNPVTGQTSPVYTTLPLSSTARYWVRISNALGTTDSSTATITMAFTDAPLTVGLALIRAIHVLELRVRIDALRARFGLTGFSWADAQLRPGASVIRAEHIENLRTALADVYAAAGSTPPTYTDPMPWSTPTIVKAVHIEELRAAIAAVE